MTMTESMTGAPAGVHLVGGVPLDRVDDVLRAVAGTLGRHVRRIPDGEIGLRRFWVGCQLPVLAFNPAFEMVPPGEDRFPGMPTVGLRHGIGANTIEFGSLGYAGSAALAWEVFRRLQGEGVIPPHCRLQVSLPGPLEVVAGFVRTADQLTVEPAYAAAMRRELDRILEAVPASRLAIQWDTCLQVGMIDGWWPSPFEGAAEQVVERLAVQASYVPGEVELGLHLCYGDYQHRHFLEPTDLSTCVALANHVCRNVGRSVDWIHMPVPIERDDDEYFAPLADLALQPDTELYLGLVHYRDGVEGATRRISAARRFVTGFGVATECGMARRPSDRGGTPESLSELLAIHAAAAVPVAEGSGR